jgi:hypothetical protein
MTDLVEPHRPTIKDCLSLGILSFLQEASKIVAIASHIKWVYAPIQFIYTDSLDRLPPFLTILDHFFALYQVELPRSQETPEKR